MREYKFVFTGPMGAGKTTAIGVVSEEAPVSTDVTNLDDEVSKAMTTVGLDFGQLSLENGDRLRLYGTPGQSRFDFMWDILIQDALGLIILIDASRPDPLGDLTTYLDGFSNGLKTMPCTIGIGRSESSPLSFDSYAELLEKRGLVLPILPVDVRRRGDVVLLLDTLLTQMETIPSGYRE